jgi:predicted aspartyl protease
MMYPYDTSFTPPAPALAVLINSVQGTGKAYQATAQIDTGADVSGVPIVLLTKLKVEPHQSVEIQDFDEVGKEVRTYLIKLELDRFRFRRLEVVALDAPHVLLGRDVLNNFRLIIDGPSLAFGFGA